MKKKVTGLFSWAKKLSWKKKTLFAVIILIVAGITYKTVKGSQPVYQFDTVKRGTITEVVTETGNVAVSGEYAIPSPSTGLLSAIYVQNGATVSAGQKLFLVTSTATPQQKQAAWATYASAKSQLDAANAQLFALQSVMFTNWKIYTDIAENSTYQNADSSPNTSNRVLTPFTTVQDNWLSSEANYKNQQSVIASAQAAATSAYTGYLATQDTVVTAPVAGTIHNVSGVVGSMVSAPAGGTSATALAIISTGSALTVTAPVNEVDINKIHVGDPVTISFDAILNKTFTGTIIQADEFGANVAGVINYTIYASVDDGTELIRPGMTANLTVETNKHENALTVVNAAIRPYKGGRAIQTLDTKGKATYVPVTVGIKGPDRTEILSGAKDGEKVIIGGGSAPAGPSLTGN